MGFGQFLSAPEYSFKVITHRSIFQNAAQENSRFGDEYVSRSAVIILDSKDLKKMDVENSQNVVVKSNSGKVIVKAVASEYETSHEGIAYMINGPWANALVCADTGGTGVPKFKLIEVTVSKAKDEELTVFE